MVTFSFLIVAWIVLLAIFLWDLIQHGVDKIWMFIVIPATLVLTVTTYTTVQSMLGYPTDKVKEGKFVVSLQQLKNQIGYFTGLLIKVMTNLLRIDFHTPKKITINKKKCLDDNKQEKLFKANLLTKATTLIVKVF